MTLEDVVASSNRSIEKSSIANFSRQRFLHLSSLEKGNSSIFRRFVDESTPEFSTTALSNFFLSHSLSLSLALILFISAIFHAHTRKYTRTREKSLSLSLSFSPLSFEIRGSIESFQRRTNFVKGVSSWVELNQVRFLWLASPSFLQLPRLSFYVSPLIYLPFPPSIVTSAAYLIYIYIFRGWKMKNISKGSCVDGIERGIVSDSLNMSKEKKKKYKILC